MGQDNGSAAADEGRWAPLPEALIYDHRVSAQAVRVYAALARHGSTPDTCHPRHTRIAELIGASARSVPTWIRELEAAGWLTRHPRFTPGGAPDANGYSLRRPALASAGVRATQRGGARQPARGVRAEQRGGCAPHSAPEKESNGTRASERESPIAPTPLPLAVPAPPAARGNGGGGWTLAFDAFWQAYPRQAGRPAARRAWERALRRGADPAAIVAGAQRYAADPNRADEYTKNPEGWLDDGRWEDGPLPQRTQGLSRMQRALGASQAARSATARDSVVSLPPRGLAAGGQP